MASRTRSKNSMAQLTGAKEGRESSSRSRIFFNAVFGSSISRGSGTHVKQRASQHSSAMRVACTQNDVKCLRKLLAEPGCDPNAADATGTTPLLIAARLGHADCCRELLIKGANVGPTSSGNSGSSKSRNRYNSNNLSGNANELPVFSSMNALPLEEAAKAGHMKAVEVLLAGGAPIDARNHIGNTALHFACMRGHVNVVRCLLEAGANHALVNLSNNTPLSLAVTNLSQSRTIHCQARHGSAGVCAVLVEHDVDLNLGNSLGTAPLATASRYGHTEVVEWLLAAPSVRVDATDDAGFTALHEASREGHLDIVIELLRARANPVPRSYADGVTPLHEACREGHIDLARELLMAAAKYSHKVTGSNRKSKSASRNKGGGGGGSGGNKGMHSRQFDDDSLYGPNPLDYRGNTPLHDACREGHADVCSDLLAAGADQTIVNENGLTPLQEAQAGGHSDCMNVLESDAVDEREFRKKTKSKKFKVTPLPNEHQLRPVEPVGAPPDFLGTALKASEAIAHAATSFATQLDPSSSSAAEVAAAAAKAKACGGGGAHTLQLQVLLLEGACDANAPFLVRAACADAMCLEIGQITCGPPLTIENPDDVSLQPSNSDGLSLSLGGVAALEVCVHGLPSAAALSQVRAAAVDTSSSGLAGTLDMIGLGSCRVSALLPGGKKSVHVEAKGCTGATEPMNPSKQQNGNAVVKKPANPATPLPPPSAPRDGNSRDKNNHAPFGQGSAFSPVAKRLDFFDDDDETKAETFLPPKSSAAPKAPQGSALDGIMSPNVSCGRSERGSESEEEQELLDQIMASFNGKSSNPPPVESQARSKPKNLTKATPANSQSRSANADKSRSNGKSSSSRGGDVSSSRKSGSKSDSRRAVSPTTSPTMPPTKLHRAARSNDIIQLKKLLAPPSSSSSSLSSPSSIPRNGAKSPPSSGSKTPAGMDPNVRCGRKGLTPLMECAMRGFAEATAVLLAHGADRDLRDFVDGSTALTFAIQHRRDDVVGVLTAPPVNAPLSAPTALSSPVPNSKREGTSSSSSSAGPKGSNRSAASAPPAPVLPAVAAAATATSLLAARVAAARAAARPHSPMAELLIGGGGLRSPHPLSGLPLVDDKPPTRPPPSAAALAAAAAAREAAAAAEAVEWADGRGLSGPKRSNFTPANRVSSPRASSPRASSPRASSPRAAGLGGSTSGFGPAFRPPRTTAKVPKPRSRSPRGARPAPAYSEWTGKSIFSAMP